MPRKPDAKLIEAFLDELPNELRYGDERRRAWPRYVYRFDDVRSIAEILTHGALFSRARCEELGIEIFDAAHRGIIERTAHLHKYARLFFRPRTPTQWGMEGIRPAAVIAQQPGTPHCPVPVYLFFDAKDVLTRRETTFTDGSPARVSECSWGTDAQFLQNIPFDAVYHDDPMPPDMKEKIKFHRHAEVLVDDELDLNGLREIVCRTGPERDTLLDLLGNQALKWAPITRLERAGEQIFNRRFLFVESVTFQDNCLWVDVANPHVGVFDTTVTVVDADTSETLVDKSIEAKQFTRRSKLALPAATQRAHMTIRTDRALAFQGVRAHQRVLG